MVKNDRGMVEPFTICFLCLPVFILLTTGYRREMKIDVLQLQVTGETLAPSTKMDVGLTSDPLSCWHDLKSCQDCMTDRGDDRIYDTARTLARPYMFVYMCACVI